MRNRQRPIARLARNSGQLIANLLANVDALVADVTRDSQQLADDSRALLAAATTAGEQLRFSARGMKRFSRIATSIAGIVVLYRTHRVRAEALGRGRDVGIDEIHARAARRLRTTCEELGGGILKIGQFLSSRPDLLPPVYIEELARLRDSAPPVPAVIIRERIEEELGAAIEDLFSEFQDEPLGTASLAQVHRARTVGGADVAIKVQLPGVRERVEVDAAALDLVVTYAADLLPPGDWGTIAAELARSLRAELDFAAEAERAQQFGRRFAEDERAHVPRVLPELSTGRLITMEFSAGTPLVDYLESASAPERDRTLGLWVDLICTQVLRHGIFHGDPHPGNFLVEGEQLVLLDFGCVMTLDEGVRTAYAQTVGAAIANDRQKLAAALDTLGFVAADGQERLLDVAEQLMTAMRDRSGLKEMADDPKAAAGRLLRAAQKAGRVEIPQHFVLLARVLGATAGLLMHYGDNVDVFTPIASHVATALSESRAPR